MADLSRTLSYPEVEKESSGEYERTSSKNDLTSESTPPHQPTPKSSIRKVVRHAALAAATEKQKPSPWTKAMFQLYGCCLVACLASVLNGYQSMVINQISGTPEYREYFGFSLDVTTGFKDRLAYCMYPIGNICAWWLTGPASDWKGRRFGLFTGSGIVMCGHIIMASAQSLAQYLSGQFIMGVGTAVCAGGASTIYVAEMAHPSFRGVMSGLYNCFWIVGNIIGTNVCLSTINYGNNGVWRVPLWCLLIVPGLMMIGTIFIPESPRWLIANGREEEALATLVKYHGEGDRESPIVQLEYSEMVHHIPQDGADKRFWDYKELFNSHEGRYRLGLAASMIAFSSFSGNVIAGHYNSAMVACLGISDHKYMIMGRTLVVIILAGGVTGAYLTDKIGRRRQLLWCVGVLLALCIALTPLLATNLSTDAEGETIALHKDSATATIVLYSLVNIVAAAGFAPLQTLYIVETLRYETRAKSLGFVELGYNLTKFYNYFVSDFAFDGASWKYNFFPIAWDILALFVIYYFYVETSNRTLEEINEIFLSQKPVKTSLTKSRIIISGDEIVVNDIDSVC